MNIYIQDFIVSFVPSLTKLSYSEHLSPLKSAMGQPDSAQSYAQGWLNNRSLALVPEHHVTRGLGFAEKPRKKCLSGNDGTGLGLVRAPRLCWPVPTFMCSSAFKTSFRTTNASICQLYNKSLYKYSIKFQQTFCISSFANCTQHLVLSKATNAGRS